MAKGGSSKNALRGLKRGIKNQWEAFHDDQRLSWIGHFLVCLVGSAVLALLTSFLPWGISRLLGGSYPWLNPVHYHTLFSIPFFAFFMWRETGDEDYHRNVLKDWDTPDKDVDEQGREREGVTPRFDKIGDLTGPLFHMVTCLVMSAYIHFAGGN